jgi:hypothetical protein
MVKLEQRTATGRQLALADLGALFAQKAIESVFLREVFDRTKNDDGRIRREVEELSVRK